jgi:hypothetical protein
MEIGKPSQPLFLLFCSLVMCLGHSARGSAEQQDGDAEKELHAGRVSAVGPRSRSIVRLREEEGSCRR